MQEMLQLIHTRKEDVLQYSIMHTIQQKAKEIAFFDHHAESDVYDAFTPKSNALLISAFQRLTNLPAGSRIIDIGCGSGVFTQLLREAGYRVVGLDISPKLVERGKDKYSGLELIVGDAEALPFADGTFDGVLLSGIVHHFPDPRQLASETYRVLRSGGRFMAFDPNRMNPFMYLYRDRSSPFYSSIGVTENERPLLPKQAAAVFANAGFSVATDYLSGLALQYLASKRARIFLPIYNWIDRVIFGLPLLRPVRSFVLTSGEKPLP